MYLKLAAVTVAAAACFGGGYQVATWRATTATLERERAEAKDAHRRAETALRAAQQFEEDRSAIQSRLVAAQGRLSAALAVPVPQCPALELGRLVIPRAALDGLRDAAGEHDADAAESGPAVPGRSPTP